MNNDLHKESEKILWKRNEENRPDKGILRNDLGIGRTTYPSMGYIEHRVNETDRIGSTRGFDLGDHYLRHMQNAMEEWYSKPRDGQAMRIAADKSIYATTSEMASSQSTGAFEQRRNQPVLDSRILWLDRSTICADRPLRQ